MPRAAFHPDEVADAIGPAQAFDPASPENPSAYALQNHLAVEVVAHLQEAGVISSFRGGTPLHAKLPQRRRFSVDADVSTASREAVHAALRDFAARFPKSDVRLVEPPRALKLDGVQHTLLFGHTQAPGEAAPVRILVEVVEAGADGRSFEPLRLRSGALDWGVDVTAPTFEGFTGQKLAVLGPNTLGKPVGLNVEFARPNQSVAKQIFDLRELLRLDLDAAAVRDAYEAAVAEANALRGISHASPACLEDARALLVHLRRPRTADKAEPVRYGLWSGYRDTRGVITAGARDDWRPEHYRIAAGSITRLAVALSDGDANLDAVRRPLVAPAVPREILEGLEKAQAGRAPWFSAEDFGADARLAWAWAPRELW